MQRIETMNSDHNDRKQRGCGSKCVSQHIVPRFIVARWAKPYKPGVPRNRDKVSYMDHAGVNRASSGSSTFCGKLIYSDDLDESWGWYESSMPDLLTRFLDRGETDITIGELIGCIRPYMAGAVARSYTLMEKLASTPLEECSHWAGPDIMRMLTMEMMMTALSYADITMVSGDGELALPGDGYVFLEPKGGEPAMIAPISPDMALKATWRRMASSATAEKELNPVPDRINSDTERMLCMSGLDGGMKYVAARSRKMLHSMRERYNSERIRMGGRRNILSWVLSWLPLPCIRDWAKTASELMPGGRKAAEHDPNGYWASRQLLQNGGRMGGWRAPAVIVPSPSSTLKLSVGPAPAIMDTKADAGNSLLSGHIRWDAFSPVFGDNGQIREY